MKLSDAARSDLKDDYYWMAEAIRLAKKGRFTTSPNPCVGSVIVDQHNRCVGKGYHIQAGTPHAEIHALAGAGDKAAGATAYVTLEPCSHYGLTPPCVQALIKAAVSRVVVAMTDPNPLVSGQGIKALQDTGISVTTGVMAAEAAALNRGFIKRMIKGKPFVTVKLAVSLDGKIALQNGVSQWITGAEARGDVHRHRAQSCAVVTGSGTAMADNPSLLVRPQEAAIEDYPLAQLRQPLRVVVDTKNRLPDTLQMFNDGYATVVATSKPRTQVARAKPLDTMILPAKGEYLDLSALLNKLAQRQVNHLWVEAGPGLAGAFLEAGEVDELIVYQAPVLLGDKARNMVNLPNYSRLQDCHYLQLQQVRQVGKDIKLTYRVGTV